MGILLAKKSILILALLLFAVTLQSSLAYAADPLLEKLKQKGILTEDEAAQIEKEYEKREAKLPKGLEGISIGALAYIDYSAGNSLSSGRQGSYNQFAVTRGYINFTKQVTPWFSVRITPDIFQETVNDGSKAYGSWLLRFKYYYAQFNLPDLGLITKIKRNLGWAIWPGWIFRNTSIPTGVRGLCSRKDSAILTHRIWA